MNSLLEELNCETVFTIPVFGGIGVSEAVVVTWIIMAVLVVLCLCLVRNLKVENPGKKQLMLETAVSGLYNFFEEIVGEKGRRYIPYLSTVAIYIGIANLIGLFGFKPPTKALNVTAALAVMSIILVEYSGIHAKGVKGWVKSFVEPSPIIAPINVMELFIKPLSLCMRLFGNVLGAFVIMELLKIVVPLFVPVVFSCYFDMEAKTTAKTEYDRIVSDANSQAGKIIENAEKTVVSQREKTLRGLESQIAGLAIDTAAKVIGEQAGSLDNAKLYDEFLNKAGDAHDTDIN